MEKGKERKHYSAESKYKIVKEALTTDQSISEICCKYNIGASLFYKWQEHFFEGAKVALENGKVSPSAVEQRKIESLEGENNKLKGVIAEITSENIDLKKKFSI